jgi:HAD superfamily hydrolase (TIGR01509 family)
LRVLVLDAMGVIYPVKDDVKDLLYPFILEKHGIIDFAVVDAYYKQASLGEISATKFWQAVGLTSWFEDEYLSRFKLADGLLEFLEKMKSSGIEIWCLSNDLSEWSQKVRARLGLEKYFRGFIISGDVGIRKPDPLIYNNLLNRLNVKADKVVFVDDRAKNLEPASALGFTTILFSPEDDAVIDNKHLRASAFNDILAFV